MGLPSAKDKNIENLTKRFSDDILKIELSGPEHHHLSVVDVPGLFHSNDSWEIYDAKNINVKQILPSIKLRRILLLFELSSSLI